MMSSQQEITELIEKVKKDGPEAAAAAARLVAIGMPAVQPVIAALREHPDTASRILRDIIPQIRTPEIVPVMLDVLHEQDTYLPLVAFQSLGQSKDSRAFQPILEQFLDTNNSDAIRFWAADALGELGDVRAIPELLTTVREIARKRELKYRAPLARFIIIALVKLGNQEAADIAIAMLNHRDRNIRDEAALTLPYIIGPGLFPALQKALRRKSKVCRENAIDALFYLGHRESIKVLIASLSDQSFDLDITDKTLDRIRDLTGEAFEDDIEPEDLRKWWEQHQSKYESSICYRLGEPISVPHVCALLSTKTPVRRYLLFEEVRIITGMNFGLSSFIAVEEQDDIVARAQEWAQREAHKFEVGAVYKYGHKQDVSRIFEP